MELIEFDNIRQFLLSGNAHFTVENSDTNKHFTFRVSKCKDSEMFFVSVNTEYEQYIFIANLWTDENRSTFRLTPSKKFKNVLPQSVQVFQVIIDRYVKNNNPHPLIKFYHHCKCGRCGRKLTTPKSIKNGIGPYCLSKS